MFLSSDSTLHWAVALHSGRSDRVAESSFSSELQVQMVVLLPPEWAPVPPSQDPFLRRAFGAIFQFAMLAMVRNSGDAIQIEFGQNRHASALPPLPLAQVTLGPNVPAPGPPPFPNPLPTHFVSPRSPPTAKRAFAPALWPSQLVPTHPDAGAQRDAIWRCIPAPHSDRLDGERFSGSVQLQPAARSAAAAGRTRARSIAAAAVA
jgi:hypothetical protein